MKKSALILLTLATLSNADFTRDASTGVVTDNKTQLEWQDDYSDNTDSAIKITNWNNALTYCNTLELDGGGWRLPNINELKSIVVDKAAPTIDDVFENTSSSYYWSSTTYASSTSYAWIVGFNYGVDNSYGKSSSDFVRCVRAGQ